MIALDKVIEKYNGLHRRSIVEYDAQNRTACTGKEP